jgi:glutamate racemase
MHQPVSSHHRNGERQSFAELLIFSLLLGLSGSTCMETGSLARQEGLDGFFARPEVTIAITDSGLGGLSILAEAVERMQRHRSFRRVRFVYYNALFSEAGGYNSLDSRPRKIQIFDSALHALSKDYNPDLILIGCNTLSVLYPDTGFALQADVPVRGIVEAGVDLIAEHLRHEQESRVLILGTQTTVEEGTHRRLLVQKGFLPERIHLQACPDLVPYIERGFASGETEMLISAYVEEALQRLPDRDSPLLVSLNCTHYGYARNFWESAFRDQGIPSFTVLDPNIRMLEFLFPPEILGRCHDTVISVEVVSMVAIGRAQQESIGTWLAGVSPRTAEALRAYRHVPGLFEWKSWGPISPAIR